MHRREFIKTALIASAATSLTDAATKAGPEIHEVWDMMTRGIIHTKQARTPGTSVH